MTSAIIAAAGSSSRMGFNKLLAPLGGTPVLLHTLQAFEQCDQVGEIIVVAGDDVRKAVAGWSGKLAKLKQVVAGGVERHLSVWEGLKTSAPDFEIVAVHDGGRPLITPAQIARCIARARETGAAVCGRPVTETLKQADENGRIVGSIDRAGAWIMETPQVFRRDSLMRAFQKVLHENLLVTDEASAVQLLGEPVFVVRNDSPNPKITFPADLLLAEKLLGQSHA